MISHVILDLARVSECLWAEWALVWFLSSVSGMSSNMSCSIGCSGKILFTYVTLERTLSSMGCHMNLELRVVCEHIWTQLALMWFLYTTDHNMFLWLWRTEQALLRILTLAWILSSMISNMNLQFGRFQTSFFANVTNEWFLPRVEFVMPSQIQKACERLFTYQALILLLSSVISIMHV